MSKKQSTRKAKMLLALAAGMSLLASGCGDDSTDEATEPPPEKREPLTRELDPVLPTVAAPTTSLPPVTTSSVAATTTTIPLLPTTLLSPKNNDTDTTITTTTQVQDDVPAPTDPQDLPPNIDITATTVLPYLPIRHLEQQELFDATHPHELPEEQFDITTPICAASETLEGELTPELVEAIEYALNHVYSLGGPYRIDAIDFSGFANENMPVYNALGAAADLLPVKPNPTIDFTRQPQWLGVERGQYVGPSGCVTPKTPNPEALGLLVPVNDSGINYDTRYDAGNGQTLKIQANHLLFRWRQSRWQISWKYWCASITESQGITGQQQFNDIVEEILGFPFACLGNKTGFPAD